MNPVELTPRSTSQQVRDQRIEQVVPLRTPQELLAKYREFRQEGLDIVNARRGGPGNQPRFYARDPDGNLLEFYWGMDTVGGEGRPRAHSAIAEIDLEQFDFEAFEREQQSAAAVHDEFGSAR